MTPLMNKLAIILAFTLAFSCKEISFKEPQPKGKKVLREVPKQLIGTYLLIDDKEGAADTLFVSVNGYLVASDKKQNLLGDSLILKKFKGYYFVNINEKPEWLLRVLKQEENGDLIYMSMEEDEEGFNKLLKRISQEVQLDSMEVNGEKLYQIDPTPKQLVKLIETGHFKKTIRMKRMK